MTRIFITIIINYKTCLTTVAENLNVQMFSCYIAMLCLVARRYKLVTFVKC